MASMAYHRVIPKMMSTLRAYFHVVVAALFVQENFGNQISLLAIWPFWLDDD